MAYAIVKTGGKQYRVEAGQELLVERLAADVDSTVELQPLLLRSSDITFAGDKLAKATVTARIIRHERGEKIRIFKFKPKSGYKKTLGHRQELTRISIQEISSGA